MGASGSFLVRSLRLLSFLLLFFDEEAAGREGRGGATEGSTVSEWLSWLPAVYEMGVGCGECGWWRVVKCKNQAEGCVGCAGGGEGGGERRGMKCATERANKLTLPLCTAHWPMYGHRSLRAMYGRGAGEGLVRGVG